MHILFGRGVKLRFLIGTMEHVFVFHGTDRDGKEHGGYDRMLVLVDVGCVEDNVAWVLHVC